MADDAGYESASGRIRKVDYRYSSEFVPILDELGVTLLISTYQAGKLVVVSSHDSRLCFEFLNFDQAMGIAVSPQRIALGTRNQIWFLHNASELAAQLSPAGRFDGCYLARCAHVTGRIQVHELAWGAGGLWIVNTLFSCLCTVSEQFSFVPQWRPPFISHLEANDRCHLNGLAMVAGHPRFVTALAETDSPAGWRPSKTTSGCVVDVSSGETLARGFAMPHSPRWRAGRLWLLDSGRGQLGYLDPATGSYQVVTAVPGYTRGLAFQDRYAFVGLSRIRETAVFGGVPIAEHRDELRCGLAIVDTRKGASVAYLEFLSGVDEIFDVQVVPHIRRLALTGPLPEGDLHDIWLIPPEAEK